MLYVPGRLRILRLATGQTQRSIGGWIGVPAATVGRYERGEAPIPAEHQAHLAELFGVNIPWLMGEDWDALEPETMQNSSGAARGAGQPHQGDNGPSRRRADRKGAGQPGEPSRRGGEQIQEGLGHPRWRAHDAGWRGGGVMAAHKESGAITIGQFEQVMTVLDLIGNDEPADAAGDRAMRGVLVPRLSVSRRAADHVTAGLDEFSTSGSA